MTIRRRLHRLAGLSIACAIAAAALPGAAGATPSTQIFIPSTDTQPFKTFHFGFDTYVRTSSNDDGERTPPIVDLGLTAGLLPFDKIRAEAGIDLIFQGGDLDRHPVYFNAKIATPEDAWFTWSPAVAVGGLNFGTNGGDVSEGDPATDQNVVYGLVARTFPVIGRLSAGYYTLNDDAVAGAKEPGGDDNGVLLSWDRTLSEISDKIWVAVDYLGGDNALGSLNFGISYAFSPNTSVIFGYDVYNENRFAGEDTFNVQLDINF